MSFSRRDFMEKTDVEYEQSLYQEMFNEEMKWFVEKCILEGQTTDFHNGGCEKGLLTS